MGIYKELDSIIKEHVGEIDDDGQLICNDTVLFDIITKECSDLIKGDTKYEELGKDAQLCVSEWYDYLEHSGESNFEERWAEH